MPLRWIVVACFVSIGLPARADESAPGLELFERHVRPVLVETCQKCHGPDKQESDLRVDSREALLRGGGVGPAVVPGQPAKSLLVEAIRRSGDLKMPPKGKLAEDQVASIARWIELGAPWPATQPAAQSTQERGRHHWAFQPVRDPPVPQIRNPQSEIRNEIDHFIHARMESAGLTPSPPADRRTLIRRATFDLTGLPPTPEEVDAFVADDHPRAWERLIERLLASPHYGEHWGRHWLDVARYSDTKGYVYAREQRFWLHAWVYRDWVVQALNDDLPYDRFLLLQIAADQAAADEPRHLAAMGFLTLGRRFLGVQREIIDDRIDVLTRGTMGLTVACARCHDHKYDPIPTRDYYSLYGVFQSCAERIVPIDEPGTNDAHEPFAEELVKRKQKLAETLSARRKEVADRNRARIGDYLQAQLALEKYPYEGFDQILAKTDLLPLFVRRFEQYLQQAAQRNDPVFAAWHAYAALPAAEFSGRAATVTEQLAQRPAGEVHSLVAAKFSTPPASMAEVAARYGELFADIERQWQELMKTAAEKSAPSPDRLSDAAAESLRQVLYRPTGPCEVPDEPIVNIEYYLDSGTCDELWKLQNEVDNWILQGPPAARHAVVLMDRNQPATPRVFRRGNPANRGDEVPRQFVEVLAGPDRRPFEHGSGRLELARAIIDPANPLTARVAVNRAWMHHFGAGLVLTPSDFGTRAQPPSHPDLLDWLASRFVEDGWSLKSLHRRIMLSAAYQQSSRGPADPAALAAAVAVDPENRLLWRMNQRRLTFEELRDALYAASGELDIATGGKAAELFAGSFQRRTLYGLVDRQFLPGTLRVFDFANPDLHIPQRSDTTVPQQALFFLNDQLLLGRARALAGRLPQAASPEERVQHLYRRVFQRPATTAEVDAALALVQAPAEEPPDAGPPTAAEWQYGYAAFDEQTARSGEFSRLPHFTGSAWQGGPAWPDAKLGWVQLTAGGGHAGNDAAHAAVRRWTAPRDMMVAVRSSLVHDTEAGDGVRGRLVSSRHGLVKVASVHNSQAELSADALELKAGDTLDFAVDIGGTLNNDQFTWEATIAEAAGSPSSTVWNSQRDFQGPRTRQLTPWEQLAQVLLSTNEFLFLD